MQEKINNFLSKYKGKYSKFSYDDFQDKIYNGYTLKKDIINQIYCFLELVDIKKTDYYIFYQYLKKNGFLKENMLEVCCEAIPILTNLIYQDNYKITAIDKKVVVKDFDFAIFVNQLVQRIK